MPERSVPAGASIAYVLKAYPRLSETYIQSEIYRLERAGLPLRLYSINPVEAAERGARHQVLDQIRARPTYLPPLTSVSGVSLPAWLRINLRRVAAPLWRTARRWPVGTARAALAAFAQAVRARPTRLSAPRKVYLKELLQAVALSDRLRDAPDVRHLHAHYAHGATTVTWLASTITGLPFSFTAHAKDVYSESLNPAGLLRRKLLQARFAVTCTAAGGEHLRRIAPEARVVVIYHGLTEDVRRLVERDPGREPRNGSIRLLGVGRLVEKKGFDTLVEACGLLRRTGVAFQATIAGPDGPHGPVVRDRIQALRLEQSVHLTGAMSQAQLVAEYQRADVFCLPCRVVGTDRDGIPNVLVEAMACGTPVVSTQISGIPELVTDGLDGVLVAPDDATAIAAAITRISEDAGLAHRMSSAARATVTERFDGERLIRPLAQLFLAEIAA
jgi:glycosyltransferase involved in cell wall biosynthesis